MRASLFHAWLGQHRTILALGLALAVSTPGFLTEAAPATCDTVIIGNDTSDTNRNFPIFSGRSLIQTFQAQDTIIQAITGWRRADEDTNFSPLHLFVLEVDSLDRPLTGSILQDGPILTFPFGDGVNPVRLRFELDPPLVLPASGKYAFVLKDELCFGLTNVLIDTLTSYPEGRLWFAGKTISCGMQSADALPPFWDLIFEIEFCTQQTTGVDPRTDSWGKVKARYR